MGGPDSALPRRRFRFAPSPNGLLHRGHAYSALLNARLAATVGGVVLLRLENIDPERCRAAYEAAIVDDLAWLGFAWQDPVRRQSEHLPAYAASLARLDARGLLYPCFCSRGDIARAVGGRADWPRDPDGSPLYPGTCRHLAASERARRAAAGPATARRLDMAAALAGIGAPLGWQEWRETREGRWIAADAAAWGDVVLARKDVPTSYHLAVVTDDADQGITDVVRGEDLYNATSVHRVLQHHLGFPAPAYHHHGLILDAGGHKLSKSRRSPSIEALRRSGVTAGALRAGLGF